MTFEDRLAAHKARLADKAKAARERNLAGECYCGAPGELQGAGATAASKPWFCKDHRSEYFQHNRGMQ